MASGGRMTFVSFLRVVHVLSAILFLGFGLASFFYKSLAWRTQSASVVRFSDEHIVLADWVFTVPAGLMLPLSGALLVQRYGLPWATGWVVLGVGGYLLAALAWLPAARLQLRMRAMSRAAADAGQPLPAPYASALRAWQLWGIPSFAGAVLTLVAMIAKVSLW